MAIGKPRIKPKWHGVASLEPISYLIEDFGLDKVRGPHVKHLRGPLSEMRMKGRDGISRALYVNAPAGVPARQARQNEKRHVATNGDTARPGGARHAGRLGRRVVVVRVFIKKSEKTPNREIRLALDRAKEVLG